MKIRFLTGALILISALGLGGCMNSEKAFVNYMKEKYGESFIYIESWGGQPGSKSSGAILKSENFIRNTIRVARYENGEGKFDYYDNYMAVKLHEDAYAELNKIIKQVCPDADLFFDVPGALLDANPVSYGLEDYLTAPDANLSIMIVNYAEQEEGVLQEIAKAFGERGIAVHGILFFAGEGMPFGSITESDLDKLDSDENWYQACVNFYIESDGSISYEYWRQ